MQGERCVRVYARWNIADLCLRLISPMSLVLVLLLLSYRVVCPKRSCDITYCCSSPGWMIQIDRTDNSRAVKFDLFHHILSLRQNRHRAPPFMFANDHRVQNLYLMHFSIINDIVSGVYTQYPYLLMLHCLFSMAFLPAMSLC